MTELLEVLYTYAQEHLLPAYLCQDQIYASSAPCAQRQTERLLAALTGEEQIYFKRLLDELELVQCARDRAAFRSGFRLALALARV